MLVVPNENGGNSGACDVNKAYVDAELRKKVNVIPNKGLSTNDFTDDMKEKISQLNSFWETVEG